MTKGKFVTLVSILLAVVSMTTGGPVSAKPAGTTSDWSYRPIDPAQVNENGTVSITFEVQCPEGSTSGILVDRLQQTKAGATTEGSSGMARTACTGTPQVSAPVTVSHMSGPGFEAGKAFAESRIFEVSLDPRFDSSVPRGEYDSFIRLAR